LPEQFRVLLEKEAIVFSAAHFITFGDDVCESLHGHNYGVKVEIEGPLNGQSYVIDFIALRDQMIRLTGKLDHKVILPKSHHLIHVSQEGEEVVARFRDRRWVFPADNCVILPVDNTTAELLAAFFGNELMIWLNEVHNVEMSRIVVGVDENHGQWGIWEWTGR
jgi:6-pyruvoyltetrahydropterin/6-carboxytetrahydropterin synthase